jgi:hypothetical protein
MKTTMRCAFAAAGLLIALSGPARAQDSSLGLVPAKAPIVVQLNGFEKARNRFGKFLGNALPDIAPKIVKQIDDAIKELAEGRDLKAIGKEGRIYVVIHDLSSLIDNPQLAVLVPVSGYAEFKDSFLKADERKSLKKEDDGYESLKVEGKENPFYIVDRKNYVVLSNDKDVAKQFVKGDGKGLDTTLSKETAKAFLDQDVAAYINLKEINKQYGAQIRGFKTILDLALQGGGAMGIDKKQMELIKQVFEGFLQMLSDGVAAVIGVDFRPEGANLKLFAQFGSDTETNAFLKKFKPATLAELGTLPLGQLVYSASNFDPMLSKTLSALLKESQADDENEDVKKAIQEALKELADNGRIIEIAAGNVPANSLEIAEYKDGARAVASQLKLFRALAKTSTFGSVPLKEKPVIKENAETVGDFKLNMVKLAFDLDKAVENLPEGVKEATRAALQKMTGDGTTIWFGSSGKKVVQVTAKEWKEAKALLDDYLQGKNPLEKDESFLATRKQMPAEATMVLVADTPRFLHLMIDMVKDQIGLIPGFPGGAIPDLKVPKGKPAYFGLALMLKDEYASVDFFVPVTAVQQVRKMLAPVIDGDN